MQFEFSFAAIFEEALQCVVDGSKCDVIPGNVCLSQQNGIQGLFSGAELEIQEAGPINDMDLADVGEVDKREHRAELDSRPGFFTCLPEGGFAAGLVVLHEACRQGPEAVARLNSAAAQQDLVFPLRECSDHHLGVLVVNCSALFADVAGQAVASRDLQADGCAAMGAEVHGEPEFLRAFNSKSSQPVAGVRRQDFSSSPLNECPIMPGVRRLAVPVSTDPLWPCQSILRSSST